MHWIVFLHESAQSGTDGQRATGRTLLSSLLRNFSPAEMISSFTDIPHFPSQINLIYLLFRNVVLVLTIHNGRFRRANGLQCFVVLSRIRNHCDRLRVIMEFRMRR